MRTATLLTALALASCAPETPAGLEAAPAEPPASDTAPVPTDLEAAFAPVASDTLIALERTVCFGRCPAYRVEVDGSGTVRFLGSQHVRRTGEHSWTVPRDSVASLVEAARAVAHHTVPGGISRRDPSDCSRTSTDRPSAITTVRVGDRERRVDHYLGCAGFDREDDLEAFEREIDRALGTARVVR